MGPAIFVVGAAGGLAAILGSAPILCGILAVFALFALIEGRSEVKRKRENLGSFWWRGDD